jgi:teichuronic acid biosynthesis protein TuaE
LKTFIKYLFWFSVVASFVGSVASINALGIEFFPLRVLSLIIFPILLINLFYKGKFEWKFWPCFHIFMLLYGIFSLLWSPDPNLGFKIVGTIFTGVMLFLIVTRQAKNRAVLMKIMTIWSISVIFCSILGFYETITGNYLFQFADDDFDSIGRLTSSIGWLCPRVFWINWNNYAFVNALSSIVLIGWLIEVRGFYRALSFIAVILTIPLIFLSYSRAAIVGFFLGIVTIVLYTIIQARIKLFYKIILFSPVIGLLTVFIYNSDYQFGKNMIVSAIETKLENTDNSLRTYYYISAIYNGTVNSYGFGKGLGASTEIIEGGSYHHYMLEILAELGLWFFIGYCWLLAFICLRLLRFMYFKRDGYWSSGLLGSCIAFPFLCAGPSSVLSDGPYWLWLAFLVSFAENNLKLLRSERKSLNEGSLKCIY